MNRLFTYVIATTIVAFASVADAGHGRKSSNNHQNQNGGRRSSVRQQKNDDHQHHRQRDGHHQNHDRDDEHNDVVTTMPVNPSGSPTPITPFTPVRVVRDHRVDNTQGGVTVQDPTGKGKGGTPLANNPRRPSPATPTFPAPYTPPNDVTSVDGTGIGEVVGGIVDEIVDIATGSNFEGQATPSSHPLLGPTIRDHR